MCNQEIVAHGEDAAVAAFHIIFPIHASAKVAVKAVPSGLSI